MDYFPFSWRNINGLACLTSRFRSCWSPAGVLCQFSRDPLDVPPDRAALGPRFPSPACLPFIRLWTPCRFCTAVLLSPKRAGDSGSFDPRTRWVFPKVFSIIATHTIVAKQIFWPPACFLDLFAVSTESAQFLFSRFLSPFAAVTAGFSPPRSFESPFLS